MWPVRAEGAQPGPASADAAVEGGDLQRGPALAGGAGPDREDREVQREGHADDHPEQRDEAGALRGPEAAVQAGAGPDRREGEDRAGHRQRRAVARRRASDRRRVSTEFWRSERGCQKLLTSVFFIFFVFFSI